MMHMTFYWGKKVTILFDSWRTDSWTSYALSLLACFLVAAFYQYLEDRRIKLKLLTSPSRGSDPLTHPLLQKLHGGRAKSVLRFAGAVMFAVNSAIGYMLMLAVMSFNWGVFLAIVVGLAVGFGVFRSVDEEEGVVAGGDNPCACA
ncbi:unnamed protein product [Rhodiola kirilowii]